MSAVPRSAQPTIVFSLLRFACVKARGRFAAVYRISNLMELNDATRMTRNSQAVLLWFDLVSEIQEEVQRELAIIRP